MSHVSLRCGTGRRAPPCPAKRTTLRIRPVRHRMGAYPAPHRAQRCKARSPPSGPLSIRVCRTRGSASRAGRSSAPREQSTYILAWWDFHFEPVSVQVEPVWSR